MRIIFRLGDGIVALTLRAVTNDGQCTGGYIVPGTGDPIADYRIVPNHLITERQTQP